MADDKTELIEEATKLKQGLKVVTDEVTSFEDEKNKDIGKVKDIYDSSVAAAKNAQSKLNGFKIDFCEQKLSDLSGYDYNSAIENQIKEEEAKYNELVPQLKTQYEGYQGQLDDIIKKVKACADGDSGCVDAQKTTYEGIEDVAALPKNQPLIETEISKFKSVIEAATKDVSDTIANKETDTTACFTKSVNAKSKIDEFSTKVTNSISAAIEEITKDEEGATKFINATNTTFILSLTDVIGENELKIKKRQDGAEKKKVDIKDCHVENLDGILEIVKQEYIEMFGKEDIKSYQEEFESVITASTANINKYKTASQTLEEQLKACSKLECIDNMEQVTKDQLNTITSDIDGTLTTVSGKITDAQSNLNTSLKVLESTFSGITGSKSETFLDCIILKVNIADMKFIESAIVYSMTKIGDTIVALNSEASNIKDSWQLKQHDVLTELNKLVYTDMRNVTSYEKTAYEKSANIEDCIRNISAYANVILPKANKTMITKINDQCSEVLKVLTESTNTVHECYSRTQDLIEALRQCVESDEQCVSDVHTKTNDEIGVIVGIETDETEKLKKQITTLDEALQKDFHEVMIQAEEDVRNLTEKIIKCIKTNSALSFTPSLMVLAITLFVQLFRYIM